MKRLLFIFLILALTATGAYAHPWLGDGTGGWLFPSTSTDNAIVRFDGTTGNIQNSDATLDDNENMTLPATKTSIHVFTDASWDDDDATWTMTGTGPLVHVTGNTTTVTATNTEAIAAGTTYKVTITGTGGTATATYTLGGVTGTTIAASGAIAITDYITASTTASMIITPANTCTVSITSITIEKLTDATGDLTVEGNLTVRSPIYADSTLYIPDGTTAYPSLAFKNDLDTGFYKTSVANSFILAAGGVESWVFDASRLRGSAANGPTIENSNASATVPVLVPDRGDLNTGIGQAGDDLLSLIAGGVEHARIGITNSFLNLYETYTNGSNYEYYSLGAGSDLLTFTANTLGTGSDNMGFAFTPAGTGKIKFNAPTVKSNTTITCSSDVCTDVATAEVVYLTSSESDATPDVLTIADGVAGQEKLVVLKTTSGTDDIDVTPTNFANGTKITLDTAGESVLLHFDGTNWLVVATYGGVVS